MRIVFFGTTHGVPEPNRKYSCSLVEAGGRKYLIDAGTDPMPELHNRGIDPKEISAIFITHNHSDHIGGLVPFVDLCCWFYKDVNPQIYVPEIKAIDAMKGWITAVSNVFREDIPFFEIHKGVIFDDGVLKVTAMKTGHISNAYAFKLEAEGKKVLFTGDMKHLDGPTVDFARYTADETYDVAIGECAHFDAMQYLEPLRKNPPKRFYINHYSWTYVESCHHLRVLLKNEIPVTLVTDNYEIEV